MYQCSFLIADSRSTPFENPAKEREKKRIEGWLMGNFQKNMKSNVQQSRNFKSDTRIIAVDALGSTPALNRVIE